MSGFISKPVTIWQFLGKTHCLWGFTKYGNNKKRQNEKATHCTGDSWSILPYKLLFLLEWDGTRSICFCPQIDFNVDWPYQICPSQEHIEHDGSQLVI